MEDWTEVMESGGSIDVIYLDFIKAFDQVPYIRLLSKLSCYGLSERLMDWMHHFLPIESIESISGDLFQSGYY